ncbi:uncharacterized protein LOC115743233 [Rhodamnia argentea]|uniref:Uncharacterized protein LOC115743233 n=1 Tax=Rhodamnia argentea TaxID=178133 RepID=A0A8B8PGK1_9MYRT|nr:uncharacterized protein LOC115743233 [Rhodamnia argentea]
MESARPPQSCMPLVSRLDHLDFIMKRLESKQDSAKQGSKRSTVRGEARELPPMDLAVRDGYFKGSLVDRVATLEQRLLQLCLEMDSSSCSRTSGGKSSSQESKRGVSGSSSSTFFGISNRKTETNPPQLHQNVSEIHEEGKSDKVQQQQKIKRSSPGKLKLGKSKTASNNKKTTSKLVGRKDKPRSWPLLNLLGC